MLQIHPQAIESGHGRDFGDARIPEFDQGAAGRFALRPQRFHNALLHD
jgi:hypothetical protein